MADSTMADSTMADSTMADSTMASSSNDRPPKRPDKRLRSPGNKGNERPTKWRQAPKLNKRSQRSSNDEHEEDEEVLASDASIRGVGRDRGNAARAFTGPVPERLRADMEPWQAPPIVGRETSQNSSSSRKSDDADSSSPTPRPESPVQNGVRRGGGRNTVAVPSQPGKNRQHHAIRSHDLLFGDYLAASADFVFPDTTNLLFTAVEIMVYLPRLSRNWFIAYRFCNNGVDKPVQRYIIVHHRSSHRPDNANEDDSRPNWVEIFRADEEYLPVNNITKWYQQTMRKGPEPIVPVADKLWNDWVIREHEAPDGWDHQNISIEGYEPNCVTHRRGTRQQFTNIPFSELSVGVTKHPQGFDAGDLTRIVDYASKNPNPDGRQWMFPADLQCLKKLITPWVMTKDHTDDAAFERWLGKQQMAKAGLRAQKARLRVNPKKNQPLPVGKFQLKTITKVKKPETQAQRKRRLDIAGNAAVIYNDLGAATVPEPFNRSSGVVRPYRKRTPTRGVAPKAINDPSSSPGSDLIRNSPTPDEDAVSDRDQVIRFCQTFPGIHMPYTWNNYQIALETAQMHRINRLNWELVRDICNPPEMLLRHCDSKFLADGVKQLVLISKTKFHEKIEWRLTARHIARMSAVSPMQSTLSLHEMDVLIVWSISARRSPAAARNVEYDIDHMNPGDLPSLTMVPGGLPSSTTVHGGLPFPTMVSASSSDKVAPQSYVEPASSSSLHYRPRSTDLASAAAQEDPAKSSKEGADAEVATDKVEASSDDQENIGL